jgi:hypothetical protein
MNSIALAHSDTSKPRDAVHRRKTFGDAVHPFVTAGIPLADLLPLIPHDAVLGEESKVDPLQRGKVPGRYKGNGSWVGLSGDWPSQGMSPELQEKASQWPTQNVGLRSASFPAIDIDVQSARVRDLIEEFVEEHLGSSPVRTREGSPRVLLPFRLIGDKPISKMRIAFTLDHQRHAVEVLGHGQQYAISGIHPSGTNYGWRRWRELSDLGVDGLTGVSADKLLTFFNQLGEYLQESGAILDQVAVGAGSRGEAKAVSHLATSLDPEIALAALRAVPNTESTIPTREGLVAVLASLKAALGSKAEAYRAEAEDWATAEGWATPEYFDKVWDSISTVRLGPEHLLRRAHKAGWRGDAGSVFPDPPPTRGNNGERPLPLFPLLPPAEAYPVHALGSALSRAASAIAHKVQVPEAIAAQSVLATAALAAQAHADVLLPYGQRRPLSLYLVTVAGSGDRKSSADNEALRPLQKYEETLRAFWDEDTKSYRVEIAAWIAEKRKIESDRKIDYAKRKQLIADLGPEPQCPLSPYLTISNLTIEGLLKTWAHAPAALGVFTAEGGQFTGGHGMSDERRLETAGIYSELWDGKSIRRLRAQDGATVLYGRRLSAHLMIQPGAASTFLADELLRDQGLLSRLLVAAPESIAGTRFYREPTIGDEAAIQAYGRQILSVLGARWPLADGRENELNPRLLHMSAGATELWCHLFNSIERKSSRDSDLWPIRDVAAKSAEQAARIAGVLTIIGDVRATEIQRESMEGAVVLADWYANEALRLHRGAWADPRLLRAAKCLDWLQTRDEPEVGFREIVQFGPMPIRTKALAEEAVSILISHGWLTEISARPRRFQVIKDETST